MPAPYKSSCRIGDCVITALVIDEPEFVELCKEFTVLMTDEEVQRLIKARHVPLICAGTKTQKFFDRYGVTTSMMSIIVRGAGPEVVERYFK